MEVRVVKYIYVEKVPYELLLFFTNRIFPSEHIHIKEKRNDGKIKKVKKVLNNGTIHRYLSRNLSTNCWRLLLVPIFFIKEVEVGVAEESSVLI